VSESEVYPISAPFNSSSMQLVVGVFDSPVGGQNPIRPEIVGVSPGEME